MTASKNHIFKLATHITTRLNMPLSADHISLSNLANYCKNFVPVFLSNAPSLAKKIASGSLNRPIRSNFSYLLCAAIFIFDQTNLVNTTKLIVFI